MTESTVALEVRLGSVRVGELTQTSVQGDATAFRFDRDYVSMTQRPVLGQAFEDDLRRVWRASQRLPSFFSNLLPERGGPLRKLVARQVGVHADRELHLLAHLGDDLPGAVRVLPLTALDARALGDKVDAAAGREPAAGALHFSLAGVQLKFSMVRDERALTLPARGRLGDWIVKLPDRIHPNVPENEWSVLRWARASGIDTPDPELVALDDLGDVPPELLRGLQGRALAIPRFDRGAGEARIHIEDFAQVLSLYNGDKYEKYNFETIARIVLRLGGADDLHELVRRLVFMCLSGNADAHHKNWSLIYPDGRNARLSPAYDLVATVAYPDVDRHLALKLNRSKRFEDMGTDSFRSFARRIGHDPELVAAWALEASDRTLEAWQELRTDLELSAEARRAIETHWRSVPLARLRRGG